MVSILRLSYCGQNNLVSITNPCHSQFHSILCHDNRCHHLSINYRGIGIIFIVKQNGKSISIIFMAKHNANKLKKNTMTFGCICAIKSLSSQNILMMFLLQLIFSRQNLHYMFLPSNFSEEIVHIMFLQ